MTAIFISVFLQWGCSGVKNKSTMSHVTVRLSQSLHSFIHKSSLVRFHIKSSTSQVTSKSASSRSSIKSSQILRCHSYVKSGQSIQSILCHKSSTVKFYIVIRSQVRSAPKTPPAVSPTPTHSSSAWGHKKFFRAYYNYFIPSKAAEGPLLCVWMHRCLAWHEKLSQGLV